MSVPTPILQYTLSDATMKGLLPAGYTPLAYIEFPGSGGGIDLGYKFNALTDQYEIEFLAVSNTTQNGMILASSGSKYSWLYYYGNNGIRIYITDSNGTLRNSGNGPNDLHKHIVRYHDRKWYIDRGDSSATGTYESYSFVQDTNNLCLGDYSTSQAYPFKGKIYRVKIWNNNILQRDLIPASHSSGNGYYDLVTRVFYTRSGLIAGPELAVGKNGGKSLPEEYLLVEYLYNEDKTSWINFNRTLKSNTIMKVNMQVASYSTGAVYQQVMGYATNTTWKPYSLGIYNNAFILYSGTVDSTALPTSNFRQVIWTNSEETAETSGSTLGLFHMAGSPGNYANAGIKVQCCQILEGSSIIIKAFPCYRKSDMKPGMYDTVNGVFYTNLGSGEFILGPSINAGYTSEPNAGSGTLQGLYVNCNSIYDANKGWCLSGNDSTYSYVEFPKEIMNPLMTAKTFTIAFWFRVHNASRHILFGHETNSIYPLNIEYSPNRMRYYFSASPDKMGSTTISNNTWYHVALSVTSSGFTAYINGNVDCTHTSAPTFTQYSGKCRIGSDWRTDTGNNIFMGADITNFMIFNTALTTAQVKELYGK